MTNHINTSPVGFEKNDPRDYEKSNKFKINNMGYDLRSSDTMCDKVKESDAYAQNLYAAMCNNSFVKDNMWVILSEKTWSTSWRSAGGIVADMKKEGDYLDYYCSGMGELKNGEVPESFEADGEPLVRVCSKTEQRTRVPIFS